MMKKTLACNTLIFHFEPITYPAVGTKIDVVGIYASMVERDKVCAPVVFSFPSETKSKLTPLGLHQYRHDEAFVKSFNYRSFHSISQIQTMRLQLQSKRQCASLIPSGIYEHMAKQLDRRQIYLVWLKTLYKEQCLKRILMGFWSCKRPCLRCRFLTNIQHIGICI